MQPAQRVMLLVLPIAFIPFVLNFPSGLMLYWLTTNLWTTGQGLITRRLTPKPQPPPKKSSRTPPKAEVAAAARRKQRNLRAKQPPPKPPQVRKVKRKKGSQAVSELSVEMTGETVGEAKWAALRELERMRPGLDKAAVRFQVVTEGERGLLGVGYEPARVVASIESGDEDGDAPTGARLLGAARGRERGRGAACARSSSGSRTRSASSARSRSRRATRRSASSATATTSAC